MNTLQRLLSAITAISLALLSQACTDKTSVALDKEVSINKARVAALAINQITSSECTACASGPYQQNYLGFDFYGSTLTVSGSGFGATKGSAAVKNYSGGATTTYTVTIVSWSDTQITLRANTTLNALPGALTLTLITANQDAISSSFNSVPTVSGRVYARPNWWTNYRRIQLNKVTQPRGNDNAYTGSLSSSYVPTVGDIWLFGTNGQQAVVDVVSYRTKTISSGIYDEIYQVGTSETNPNGQSANSSNFSREIVFRRSGSSRTLTTPASSAFSSAFRNVTTTADKYYR